MSLRKKTALIVSVTLLLLSLILCAVSRKAVFEGSRKLEITQSEKRCELVHRAFFDMVQSLKTSTQDYARWDETYQFAENPENDYINRNLHREVLTNLTVDMLIIADRHGRCLYKGGAGSVFSEELLDSAETIFCNDSKIFFSAINDGYNCGFIRIGNHSSSYSACQILNSNCDGPAAGVLVFIRFLTPLIFKEISMKTGLDILFDNFIDTGKSEKSTRFVFEENRIQTYSELSDNFGNTVSSFKITADQTFFMQAVKAWKMFSFSILLICSAAVFSTLILLDRSILKRIKLLENSLDRITEGSVSDDKVPSLGNDELGRLSTAVNLMLSRLESSNAALRDSERRFRLMADNSRAVFWIRNPESGDFIYVSRAFSEIFEVDPAISDISKHWKNSICEEDRSKYLGFQNRLRVADDSSEYRISSCSGKVKWLRDRGYPVNENGKCLFVSGFAEDVTAEIMLNEEKIRISARLAQSEKMESLGILAGGVAHDLNNILVGLVSYPDLILRNLEKNHPLREPVETIRESGNRASRIVKDLLTMARRGTEKMEIMNINLLLIDFLNSHDVKEIFQRNRNVQIQTILSPEAGNISGYPDLFWKMVFNLLINACEAVGSDNGVVTVSTIYKKLLYPVSAYENIPAGDYAVLSIRDNGEGIREKDLNRIFEPFYTTKNRGKSGTGLGLAIVWGGIKDHHGYADVLTGSSGTEFLIYFPRSEIVVSEKSSVQNIVYGNSQCILVVDDEPLQRQVAQAILSSLSYRVYTAATFEEAILMFSECKPDLVLLDMILGGEKDGLDLYRKLSEINSFRAVIVSGYTECQRVEEAVRDGVRGFVSKPYLISTLSQCISEALT